MNTLNARSSWRKSAIFLISALVVLGLLPQCTDQVTSTVRFHRMTPIYTTTQEIRDAVSVLPPQPIRGTGKILTHGSYLFLNQPGEGVHVINNSDPTHPRTISFINIPGNYDLAVREDILYADSFVDLLAMDISDEEAIELLHREENVFPQFNSFGFYPDQEKGVVTRWEEQEAVATFEGEIDGSLWEPGVYQYLDHLDIADYALDNFVDQSNVPVWEFQHNEVTPVGRGGSMSRFAASGHHLYTIDDANMQVFDISTAATPTSVNKFMVEFMIETIYAHQDKLFVGAQNGMYIYDKSIPASPTLMASYWHVNSCDPVIANDSLAYVTLRTGSECEGEQNVLEVVDIKNAYSPYEVARYSMNHPHGLGLDGSTLFVCEGDQGVKVFDANHPYQLDQHLISQIQGLFAYDVIAQDNHLLVIAEDGVYQYDYSDRQNIRLLSKMTRIAL